MISSCSPPISLWRLVNTADAHKVVNASRANPIVQAAPFFAPMTVSTPARKTNTIERARMSAIVVQNYPLKYAR